MKENWAEENLQTIRTLMERSAVYRRALAPIMLFAGLMGMAAFTAGILLHLKGIQKFAALWQITAVVVVMGAFVIARRQSGRDGEFFWSPPTRRVGQALFPPLSAGMVMGFYFMFAGGASQMLLTLLWIVFYGCALHSAGFFMPRGIRWFGGLFITLATVIILLIMADILPLVRLNAQWFMGIFFGGLHFAYGIYLYLTEQKHPIA